MSTARSIIAIQNQRIKVVSAPMVAIVQYFFAFAFFAAWYISTALSSNLLEEKSGTTKIVATATQSLLLFVLLTMFGSIGLMTLSPYNTLSLTIADRFRVSNTNNRWGLGVVIAFVILPLSILSAIGFKFLVLGSQYPVNLPHVSQFTYLENPGLVVFIAELSGAFFLLLVLLILTPEYEQPIWHANPFLSISLAYFTINLLLGPISGAVLNPYLHFISLFEKGDAFGYKQYDWIYIVAPLVGAVIAHFTYFFFFDFLGIRRRVWNANTISEFKREVDAIRIQKEDIEDDRRLDKKNVMPVHPIQNTQQFSAPSPNPPPPAAAPQQQQQPSSQKSSPYSFIPFTTAPGVGESIYNKPPPTQPPYMAVPTFNKLPIPVAQYQTIPTSYFNKEYGAQPENFEDIKRK
jgi:glycerol uptake facilitator-like aquaporin